MYIFVVVIRDFIGICVSCKLIVRICIVCKGVFRLYFDIVIFCCLRLMIDVVLKEVEKDVVILGDNFVIYVVKDMVCVIVDFWNCV